MVSLICRIEHQGPVIQMRLKQNFTFKMNNEFKAEIMKAIRLSVFITTVASGILWIQYKTETRYLRKNTREIAATKIDHSACLATPDGHSYRLTHSAPPYERVECK